MAPYRPDSWRVLCHAVLVLAGLTGPAFATDYLVADQGAYREALDRVGPGDRIILADGIWEDFQIVFEASGTEEQPIYLMAETPGSVIITGQSNLRIGGNHLVVWGLTFRDGYSPTSEVISFRRDSRTLANNTRLVETVVDRFNKPDRDTQDSWVVLYGRNNRVDHNAFIGKTNRGPTMVVRLNTEGSQANNHRIERNYFGPRPPLGGNGGETLRIGTSQYSRVHSGTIVRENYFDRCDGEVEIISIKSEGNLIAENVFFESRGSVVFRHGGHNEVSRNVFFGNGVPDTGGIRVINDNQTVRGNYLEGLRGRKFLGALVVMNGVPNSPENRYHQVENARIENNSFVDVLELGFGVGSDEERSAVPVATTVSDNIFLSDEADPLGVFDDISGITFSGNVSNNPQFERIGATSLGEFALERAENGLVYLSGPPIGHAVGAPSDLRPIPRSDTGPRHYEKPAQAAPAGDVHEIEPDEAAFRAAYSAAAPGDIIRIRSGNLVLSAPLAIDRSVTIEGEAGTRLTGSGHGLFRLLAGAELTLRRLTLEQTSADAALVRAVGDGYRGAYRLEVGEVVLCAGRTDAVGPLLAADDATFARSIMVDGLQVSGWPGPVIELSGSELDGWYLADDIRISNSAFTDVDGPLIRFGREGRDESTFGPRFSLTGSSLDNVGAGVGAVHLDGIDALRIAGNVFTNAGRLDIRRRVLGWPFEISGNRADAQTGLSLTGVNGEAVEASLEGDAP